MFSTFACPALLYIVLETQLRRLEGLLDRNDCRLEAILDGGMGG